MEVKDEEIKYLKEKTAFFWQAFQFNHDVIDGENVIVIKNQEGKIPKYGKIRTIIKGLNKFLNHNTPTDIIKKNRELEEKYKAANKCPIENIDKPKNKSGIVYLLKIKDKSQYKIGVTKDFKKRLTQISPKMPFELKVEHKIESDNIYSLEEKLHNKFGDKHIKGEWFELDKEDVNYIKSL